MKTVQEDKNPKEYLVIGSNNFWYSVEISLNNAVKTAMALRKDWEGFGDPETGHSPDKPNEVYIYETVRKKVVSIIPESKR